MPPDTWNLPEEINPWIALHRTHLAHLVGTDLTSAYVKEICDEYELIKPFLPPAENVKTILDIGCGLAGIDILLQRHYPNAKLYLLEGTGPAENWGSGWNAEFKAFNDMKVTCKFLRMNGVECDGIWPINTEDPLRHDLVVSFLSWGFHYSLFKYRVKTPCAIATIRKQENLADRLFFHTDYKGKRIGKEYAQIAETEKYKLLKFSFDNLTAV